MTSAVARAEATERLQPRWIHGALTDSVLALCWVPFAIVALAFDGRPDATKALMSAVLLFSFTHQPLTLALVYGDRERFALRRRIFTWSPLVFAVAVLVTLEVSFVLLAIVGGLWNAVHTLLQRYGIVRIYGRKVGQSDGRAILSDREAGAPELAEAVGMRLAERLLTAGARFILEQSRDGS